MRFDCTSDVYINYGYLLVSVKLTQCIGQINIKTYIYICTSWYIFYFIQFQILKKMVAVIQPINKHFIN